MWIVSDFNWGNVPGLTGSIWFANATHYSPYSLTVTLKEQETGKTKAFYLNNGNSVSTSLIDPIMQYNPYGFGKARHRMRATEVVRQGSDYKVAGIDEYYCVSVDELSYKLLDYVAKIKPIGRGRYSQMQAAGKGIVNDYNISGFAALDSDRSLYTFTLNTSDFEIYATLLDVMVMFPDWWCGDGFHMPNLTGFREDTEFVYVVRFSDAKAVKKFVAKAALLRGRRIINKIGKLKG